MINDTMPVKVALVDDHVLIRSALCTMINNFDGFRVCCEVGNGKELIESLTAGTIPDVIILDLSMPKMNGHETASWLSERHPSILVLVLSAYDSELTLIRLLQKGVKGFIRKDMQPSELRNALKAVIDTGYYHSSHTNGRIINLFKTGQNGSINLQKAMLSDQESEFLQLACSDMTYKEIALLMKLNVRTIDTLRDQLFIKLDVRSRVGLAMVAMKHGLDKY